MSCCEDSKSFHDLIDRIVDVYINLKIRSNAFSVVDVRNPGKGTDSKSWSSVVGLVSEGFGILARAAKNVNFEK